MGILTIETVPGLNRHCRNALTPVFFLLAGPVRKTVHRQLAIILPGSSPLMNYLRTFRTWVTTNWALACLSKNSNTRFAAQHLNLSLERSSGGAVKVDYSTEGTTLSFDLLAALRA